MMRTITMGWILLALGGSATLGRVGSVVHSYSLAPDEIVPAQVLIALFFVLLTLLAHSWVALFLLGSSRVVRRAAREAALPEALAAPAGVGRGAAYLWILGASALVCASFILRSGMVAADAALGVHYGVFWTSILVQIITLAVQARVLLRNERSLDEIDARLVDLPS